MQRFGLNVPINVYEILKKMINFYESVRLTFIAFSFWSTLGKFSEYSNWTSRTIGYSKIDKL